MCPQLEISWRVYPTLLDAYRDYLNSAEIYERYWGAAEAPAYTAEEFEAKQRREFFDKLNRRPMEPSKPAARGTLFNAIVDSMITGTAPDAKYMVARESPDGGATVTGVTGSCDGFVFRYPIALCREFATYYREGIPQVLAKAVLPTAYGNVELYGYIDELMPQAVCDIKTTGSYSVGKFKHHAQHLVYPYCLMQSGCDVRRFEYNVAVLPKDEASDSYETYTEVYEFVPERDIPELTRRVEEFLRFVLDHADEIDNPRLFAQDAPDDNPHH